MAEVDADTGLVHAGESLALLPTLHQTLEFAVLARRAFFAFRPTAVAVELPRTIETAFRRAVLRLPFLSVILYEDRGKDGGEELVYLPVEPHEPMVEAARLALENGLTLALVDRDDGSYPLERERAPDAYAMTRTGPKPYLDALLASFPRAGSGPDRLRDRTMAYHLDTLVSEGQRVLWVGGAAHVAGILSALEEPLAQPFGRVKREGVRLANLAAESSREVMSEIPYVAWAYETARASGGAMELGPAMDTQRILDRLLSEAASRYRKERREDVPPRALRLLGRYARNLALVEGVLTPGFYELVCAARGTVDDDYAWLAYDLGATWPAQDLSRGLPEVRLRGEDLFLEGKRVRFRRRFLNRGARLRRVPVKARRKERKPGEWASKRFGAGICSYPPEDVVIEGYGNHLRQKAIRALTEETRRVVPMTTSLLDGLDMKETLRRIHEGRFYVFEERKLRGGADSVVVIFDEDEDAYPWKTTWMGEHGQESDMAFYATRLGELLDGPGIARCEYGGFLMTMPPGRLADVFGDPTYGVAESAPERLLLAALDYSLQPRVVYAAKKPPRTWLRRLAARMGKKIVYLPLGSMSSLTQKRLRRFHVLADRSVRDVARDYIV